MLFDGVSEILENPAIKGVSQRIAVRKQFLQREVVSELLSEQKGREVFSTFFEFEKQ